MADLFIWFHTKVMYLQIMKRSPRYKKHKQNHGKRDEYDCHRTFGRIFVAP